MTTKEKNDELKYVIEHYVRYNDSLNNKASVYLSINTILLAGMLGGYSALNDKHDFGIGMFILFIIAIAANGVSSLFTLFSVKSFIDNNGNNGKAKRSLFFLKELTDCSTDSFDKMWRELTEDTLNTHLLTQAKLLAAALKRKLSGLSSATWFIGVQIVVIIVFVLILFS